MQIRKVRISDVKNALKLINDFAAKGLMLPRPLNDLYENIRDYYVCETLNGEVVGVCALHIVWEDIGEIKSLAVRDDFHNQGLGLKLIDLCIEEARSIGIKRVFTLTYVPVFFQKQGFMLVDKAVLPHKVWGDCIHCPKFPDCDEQALIKEIAS